MARAKGIDVSKYQVSFNPALATVPIDFVIQRASWAGYQDELFVGLFQGGVSKIEDRGAYHYYSSGVPWQQQADLFLSIIMGRNFKYLAVDYEEGYNNLNDRTAHECRLIIDYLREKRPSAKIGLYCGAFTYRDLLLPYEDFSDVDFWIARYPNTVDPQVDDPDMEDAREDWDFWQYSKEGDGKSHGVGSTFVDLNVFNGTVEELKEYLKNEVIVPLPDPPVVPDPPANCTEAVTLAVAEVSLRYETQIENLKITHAADLAEAIIVGNNTALENLIKPYLL